MEETTLVILFQFCFGQYPVLSIPDMFGHLFFEVSCSMLPSYTAHVLISVQVLHVILSRFTEHKHGCFVIQIQSALTAEWKAFPPLCTHPFLFLVYVYLPKAASFCLLLTILKIKYTPCQSRSQVQSGYSIWIRSGLQTSFDQGFIQGFDQASIRGSIRVPEEATCRPHWPYERFQSLIQTHTYTKNHPES